MHLRPTALALMLLASACQPANAQEPAGGARVDSVRFQGAPWIPRQGLERRLGLRAGDTFDPEQFARGVERLLAHPRIVSVSPRVIPSSDNDVTLEIELSGRLAVRDVIFSGNRSIAAETLREDLRTVSGEFFSQVDVDADRDLLLRRCHERGFLLARVDRTVTPVPDAPGAVDVTFTIEEQQRVTIRAIRVDGNDSLPTRRILNAMTHRRRILFGLISRGFYRPEDFEQDLERIRRLYRSRGFLDVVVGRGAMRFLRGLREVELGVVIEEGPRYRIEAIELGGNNPALTLALKFQIRSRPGNYYDGVLLEEDRRRLLDFYQRRTFRVPQIRLTHFFKLSPDDHRVRVSFDIDERVHMTAGRVEIRGNRRTRERVIRTQSTVFPGDPITALDVQETERRVRALGLFDEVEATTRFADVQPGADPEAVRDVSIGVDEKRFVTPLLQVSAGASSGEGEIFAVELTKPDFDLFDIPGGERGWDRPFSGGGQYLRLAVVPGTRVSEFSFLFEEPYLYNSYHALSVSGTNTIYDWREFDEVHLTGGVGVRRTWDLERRLSTTLSWLIRDVEVDIDSDGDVPPEVEAFKRHTFLTYPALEAAWRDATVDFHGGPAGLIARTRLDLPLEAFGSDTDFVRSVTTVDVAFRVNRTLNRLFGSELLEEDDPAYSHTLRLGGRFGWMKDIGGGETPFFDRFMPGGPRSFRGFEYRGVGPRGRDIPTGGNVEWFGTIEYSFPIFLREIRGVALFDFGDVEERFSKLAANRIRTAVGGGLQFRLTLLGQQVPVNLYLVEPLRTGPRDREQVFTFTLGYSF